MKKLITLLLAVALVGMSVSVASAPANVLENTLGVVVVPSKQNTGLQLLTAPSGTFPSNKTFVQVYTRRGSDNFSNLYVLSSVLNDSQVQLHTVNNSFIEVDNVLNQTGIEIRVYN